MFKSKIAVADQSFFYSEIYQNNIFLFLKKLFLISVHQNDMKILKKLKQKKFKFLKNMV